MVGSVMNRFHRHRETGPGQAAELFEEYLELRNKTDRKVSEILSFYGNHITCGAGCSSCCTAITLLPVEFYAIRYLMACGSDSTCAFDFPDHRELKKIPCPQHGNSSGETSGKCLLLSDSLCSIYPHRPVICRTQGLPLLYYSDETEDYALSVCGLNFTQTGDDFCFDTSYTVDLDRLNSGLFRLNSAFRASMPSCFAEGERIPISLLIKTGD